MQPKLLGRMAILCSTAPVLWCASAAPARAQGYGLYEQGACMMGRAGAGVAAPCDDGSAMFFNPAGLASESRPVLSGGGTAIGPRGTFTNNTTGLVSPANNRTFPAPSAYGAAPIGKRVVVGVGLFAPYGLTTDSPTTSEGRFIAYKSSLASIYVQPTVAFRVTDRVQIGAGLDITHTSIELRRRVDLATLPLPGAPITFQAIGVPLGTDFADVKLTGDGNHAGAHFGVLFAANDRVAFGARYLTRQQVSIENGEFAATQISTNLTLRAPLPGLPAGTPIDRIVASAFTAGQALSAQTFTTSLRLPDQLVAGIKVSVRPSIRVFADYQYTHWALFDRLVIQNQFATPLVINQQDKDTHAVRVGAEFDARRSLVFRAGFDAHNPAAPDQSVTPILPEANRQEVTVGVGIPVVPRLRLDLAYQHIAQSDRAGRTTPEGTPNNGVYKSNSNLFGGSLVARW